MKISLMIANEKSDLANAKAKARNLAKLDKQVRRDMQRMDLDVKDNKSHKQEWYFDDEYLLHPINLYNWMSKHIKYKHDANWTLQPAQKTFDTKSGDCHDQTLFEYKVFKKYWGNKFHPMCFFITDNDCKHTHSFLAYYDRGRYFWFENAWNKHKGIKYACKNLTELKETVLVQFCSEYGGDPKNTYIRKWKTYQPGLNMKDFIKLQVGSH